MAENGITYRLLFGKIFQRPTFSGLSAIQDTFNRAFEEWKGNWQVPYGIGVGIESQDIGSTIETKPNVAALYDALWRQADQYAVERSEGRRVKLLL